MPLIRPAVPEDVREVTQLMYLAGKSDVDKSIYDVMWPGDAELRMARLAALYKASAPSWYRYDCYLVSEVGGRVAGSLCGYSEAESGSSMLIEAFKEVGIDRDEGLAILKNLQPYYRVCTPHPQDAWVIEHVAVFPEFRGRGIVTGLLEKILDRGRERGFKHAELDMLIGNTPARRAYEKVGFKVTEEHEDAEFARLFGRPGMLKMTIDL
jgi:ribosomal protein S18 acetylase RimI-like enzyme